MTRRKGRKRKPGYRVPSGDIAKAPLMERERDIKAPAYEARQRVMGVTEPQSRAMPDSSVLGVMRVWDVITERQYQGGRLFAEAMRGYDRMMLVRPLSSPSDFDRGQSFDGTDGTDDAYVTSYRRAKELHDRLRRALLNAPDPNTHMIVTAVVLDDLSMVGHCVTLRLGLTALADELGLALDKATELSQTGNRH